MKKTFLLTVVSLLVIKSVSAQVLPTFEFGAKAGMNLSQFSHTATFASDKRAGYLGGIWARLGGLGFNFQPELYLTGKTVTINSSNGSAQATLTSLDLPLLLGTKVGAFGVGGRFYAGPLFSTAINKDESASAALGNVVHLNFKDQNVAFTGGVGLDVKKFSLDLRYEYGLSKQSYSNGDDTRISLFNLTVGYRLFSL